MFSFLFTITNDKILQKKAKKKNIKYNHNMIWFEINVCFKRISFIR